MVEQGQAQWRPPPKTPAIEIIDLLSDDDDIGKALKVSQTREDRDASDGSGSDDDSQWSLYEDALQMEDDEGPAHGCKQFSNPCLRMLRLTYRQTKARVLLKRLWLFGNV